MSDTPKAELITPQQIAEHGALVREEAAKSYLKRRAGHGAKVLAARRKKTQTERASRRRNKQ